MDILSHLIEQYFDRSKNNDASKGMMEGLMRTVIKWAPIAVKEPHNTDFTAVEELGNGSLRKAVLEGDRDHGSFMAGEIAGLVKREESSKDIVEEVMQQAKEIVAGSKMAALLTSQVDVQA